MCCSLQLGHGEQEDIHGHDAESRGRPTLQTVHFPNSTEHEVTTAARCLFVCLYIKAVRPP